MSRFDLLAKEWDLKPARVQSAKTVSTTLKSLFSLEGMDVVDYGAGTGLITFNLSDEAKHITAMDNAKKMLEEIDKKSQNASISNVKTRYHDINYEHLPTDSFDLFISSMTMHHIEDTKGFIQKAKQTVKKGGYVAINDLESEDGSFHSNVHEDVAHFGFDKEEIKSIFKELGMEIVFLETIEVISKKRDFPVFLIVGRHV